MKEYIERAAVLRRLHGAGAVLRGVGEKGGRP
jgi:hypothetical protein